MTTVAQIFTLQRIIEVVNKNDKLSVISFNELRKAFDSIDWDK